MVVVLDPSKRVFLSPSCLENGQMTDRLFKTLQDHNVPKNNIITEINLNLVRSGDYLARCIDNIVNVLEIDFIPPFGFITKYYGRIETS